jgi:hypothetical protein
MNRRPTGRWRTRAAIFAVCCCVLGFYQTTTAAPKPTAKPPRAIGQPLADLVRLQTETVQELRAIRGLLEKQNRVLQALQPASEQDVPGAHPLNRK